MTPLLHRLSPSWAALPIRHRRSPSAVGRGRWAALAILRRRWAVLPPLVLLVLVAAGSVREAASGPARPLRVLVAIDATASRDPALVARAESALRRAARSAGVRGELRVPRTPTEQLSVTHYFAVRGVDLVVGVGLDRRIAVTPVARRYPDVRFALVGADGLDAALERAVAAVG